ncbi:hypothetical protein D9M70_392510 [compost metagenome]
MQVRGATLDSIQQHLVDEAHHWCVVGFLPGDIVLFVIVDGFDIQSVQVDVGQILHAAVGGIEKLVDGLAQFVIFHQDGFGGHAGAELDVGDCLVVTRVGQGDE